MILLISFGSFVAMGLPIVTAALGLGGGDRSDRARPARSSTWPDFASQLALMIGLGVGIDYALFIVTRFRENYRANGGDVDAAVEGAMNTSGRAVLFAGATVVIALLGMFALGVKLLNGVAIAAALGVVLVLAASLTLLPALLRLAGRRIGEAGRARAAARRGDRHGGSGRAGSGRSSGVPRSPRSPPRRSCWRSRPRRSVCGSAPATPATTPPGNTTRKAYDLIAQGFGKGFNGPLQVAVKLPKPNAGAALAQLNARAARDAGRRLGRGAATRRRRRHRLDPGLPALLAAERPDHEPRHAPAQHGAAAARAGDRHDRLRRRRDREPGRLLQRALEQAAAVHRDRDRALRAVAAGRVPLVRDPAAGRRDEPALDRRGARRRPGRVRARLARAVRRPARPDRGVHPGDGVRDRLRALDGLRGVPDLARPRGMASAAETRAPPSARASHTPAA